MINLLLLLLAFIVMALFYKQRQQSEYAKNYISQVCHRQGIQLLELFRAHNRMQFWPLRCLTDYRFSFTRDGITPLYGQLEMSGMGVVRIWLEQDEDNQHFDIYQ